MFKTKNKSLLEQLKRDFWLIVAALSLFIHFGLATMASNFSPGWVTIWPYISYHLEQKHYILKHILNPIPISKRSMWQLLFFSYSIYFMRLIARIIVSLQLFVFFSILFGFFCVYIENIRHGIKAAIPTCLLSNDWRVPLLSVTLNTSLSDDCQPHAYNNDPRVQSRFGYFYPFLGNLGIIRFVGLFWLLADYWISIIW